MDQTDRHTGNYLTHPDDPKRPILIDNGLGFPEKDYQQWSPFIDWAKGKTLPDDVLKVLKICVADRATWKDITELVGETASAKAQSRARLILDGGMVPVETMGDGFVNTEQAAGGIDATSSTSSVA
jgi:hypothetical protein